MNTSYSAIQQLKLASVVLTYLRPECFHGRTLFLVSSKLVPNMGQQIFKKMGFGASPKKVDVRKRVCTHV